MGKKKLNEISRLPNLVKSFGLALSLTMLLHALYNVSSQMLVLNAVQFNGNDKRFRSSSRSLKMTSRCSSATKSILWTKQKIFASGEFYANVKEKNCQIKNWFENSMHFYSEMKIVPCKLLPSMIDSNAYHYQVHGFQHRIHKSTLQHFEICCLFVMQNIVPWNSLGHHSPIDLTLNRLRMFSKIYFHFIHV